MDSARLLTSISTVAKETAQGAEETASEGEQLARLANELRDSVRRFQL